MKKPHVLQTAALLAVAMLILLCGFLAGCAPTPFVTGRIVAPPAGCSDARERGHDC
ncbi:hypothetical protein [Dechloromonas sp. TW-R-39-2]|uniref:hypothetical protein n=1 Tax=Dechloromonas sp. TW-R-39-2 TaxID=2654218 RepID=UPI00193CD8D3|nr:hypothetical protein [Dechloromonas sp. TW-R-39-2]